MKRVSETEIQVAAYGFVNGLGLSGDPEVKARLVKRARAVADRGDWEGLVRLAVAYGAGMTFGSRVRPRQDAGPGVSMVEVRW